MPADEQGQRSSEGRIYAVLMFLPEEGKAPPEHTIAIDGGHLPAVAASEEKPNRIDIKLCHARERRHSRAAYRL